MKWSYTNYLADGTIYSQATDTTQLPLVQAGGYAIVTTVSEIPVTFGAVWGIFDIEAAEIPTGNQVTIKQGESYVFHNIGSQASSLTTDASDTSRLYDYAVYGEGSGVNSKVDRAGM
ncbi:hypothetical protein [Paenibacillus polymyxa]|uniref:hypothetical protein n=1 Tax=Paenibacillus polymyxa TaxID=1406 RepID=UPI0010BF3422|nr:hypothetical protein [Paenibacillus polymyxa]